MKARLEVLRDAGRVKRLHTVPTIAHHTIADHVYGALNLSVELVDLNRASAAEQGLSLSLERVMRALLVHDVAEVHVGDIPAPAKRASSPATRADFKQREADFLERFAIHDPTLNEYERAIVKASDVLDLGWTCVYEHALGNNHPTLRLVLCNVLEYLHEYTGIIGVSVLKQEIIDAWNRQ